MLFFECWFGHSVFRRTNFPFFVCLTFHEKCFITIDFPLTDSELLYFQYKVRTAAYLSARNPLDLWTKWTSLSFVVASNDSFNVLKILDVPIIGRNRSIEISRHFSTTQQFSSSHRDCPRFIFSVSPFGKFVPPESFRNATPKTVTTFWRILLWRDLGSGVVSSLVL